MREMSSQEKPISGKLVTASDGSFVLVLDSPPGGKASTQIASKLAFSAGFDNRSKTPATNLGVGVVKQNNAVTDAKVCEKTRSVASNVKVIEESKISHTHPRVSSITVNSAVVGADASKKTELVASSVTVTERSKTNLTHSGVSNITKNCAVVGADVHKKSESMESSVIVMDRSKTHLTHSGISSITKNRLVVGADVSKKTESIASNATVTDRSKANLSHSGVSSITKNRLVVEADVSKKAELVTSSVTMTDRSKTSLTTCSGVKSITKNMPVVGADLSKNTGLVPSSVTVIHRSKRSLLHPGLSNATKNSAITGAGVSEITGLVTSNVQTHERNRPGLVQPASGGIIQNSTVIDTASSKTVKESAYIGVGKGKVSFITPVASRIILVDGKQASVQLINGKKTYFINSRVNILKQNTSEIEANVRSNTGPVKIQTQNSPVIINCSTPTTAKDSSSAGLPISITSAAGLLNSITTAGLPNSITSAAGLPDAIRSSSAKSSASSTVGCSSKVDYTSSTLPSSTSLLLDSKKKHAPFTMPVISMSSSKRDQPVSASALASLKQTVTNVQPIIHSSTNEMHSIPKSDTTAVAEMKQMENSESQICTTSKEHGLADGRNIDIVRPSVQDSAGLSKEVKVVKSTSNSTTQCLISNPVPSKLFSHIAAAKMIPTSLITTTHCNESLTATGRYTPNNTRITMSPACSASVGMSQKDSTSVVTPQTSSSSLIIPQNGSVALLTPQLGSTSLVTSQTGSKPLVMAKTVSKPTIILQTCSTPIRLPHTTSTSSTVPQTGAKSIPVIPVSSSLSLSTTKQQVHTANTKTLYAASNAPFYKSLESPPIMQISPVNETNVTKSNASNSVIMRMLPDTDSNEEHLPPTVTITVPASDTGTSVGRELKSPLNGQQLEKGIILKNVASHTPWLSSSFASNIVSNLETTESIISNPKLDYLQKPDGAGVELTLTTTNKPHSAKNIMRSATEKATFETRPLKLKIDSVFSLSNKTFDLVNSTETEDCARTCATSDVKTSGSTSPSDSVGSKHLTNVLDPCYIVLEKLSEKQIAYLMSTALQNRAVAMQKLRKRHRLTDSKYESEVILERKCSSYCRKRTLNFLCTLGMLNCQKAKHKNKPKDVSNVVPKHTRDNGENNKTNVNHPPEPSNVTSHVSGVSPVATNVAPSSNVLSHVTKVIEKGVKTMAVPKTSGPMQLQLVVMNNKLYLVPTSSVSGSSNSVSSVSSASASITCGPNSKSSSLVSQTQSQKTIVLKSTNITTSEKPQQINVVSTQTPVTTTTFQQNISSTNINSDTISPRGKIQIPPHTIPAPVIIYGPFSSDGNLNRPGISKILSKAVSSTHPSAVKNIYDHSYTSAFRLGPSAARTFSILKTPRPSEGHASSTLSQRPTEAQTIKATHTVIESKTPNKTTLIIAPDAMKKMNTTKQQTESPKLPPWKLPWNYEIKSEPLTEGYGDEEDGKECDIVNNTASDCVIANRPSALQSMIGSSTSNTSSIDIGNVHPTTYVTQKDLPSKLAKIGETCLEGSDPKSRIQRLKEILREKERMLDDLKRKTSFASILHCNE